MPKQLPVNGKGFRLLGPSCVREARVNSHDPRPAVLSSWFRPANVTVALHTCTVQFIAHTHTDTHACTHFSHFVSNSADLR